MAILYGASMLTNEQVEKLCAAIRSVGNSMFFLGRFIYMGLIINGCLGR